MKKIFITGSTDGIGKLAAIQLAKAGHQLILHGRNAAKLQQAVTEVKAHAHHNNIRGFIADFSDLSSVQNMIHQLQQTYDYIDVLINNAGVFKSPVERNSEGLDLRFVVNYLAPYQLTNGLQSLLQKSVAPRVINLSSAAQAPVAMEALKGEATLTAQEAYAQSKLALTMWSFAMAKELQYLNVIAVNPGSLLNTKMVQEAYGQYWSSADKGASILASLAVEDKHATNSGKYFDNDHGEFNEAHPDAYSSEKVQQLLTVTQQILNS